MFEKMESRECFYRKKKGQHFTLLDPEKKQSFTRFGIEKRMTHYLQMFWQIKKYKICKKNWNFIKELPVPLEILQRKVNQSIALLVIKPIYKPVTEPTNLEQKHGAQKKNVFIRENFRTPPSKH